MAPEKSYAGKSNEKAANGVASFAQPALRLPAYTR